MARNKRTWVGPSWGLGRRGGRRRQSSTRIPVQPRPSLPVSPSLWSLTSGSLTGILSWEQYPEQEQLALDHRVPSPNKMRERKTKGEPPRGLLGQPGAGRAFRASQGDTAKGNYNSHPQEAQAGLGCL